MALKIRLQRAGATNAPKYRVVVAEASSRRDGRFVEGLGYYNPQPRGKDVRQEINLERVDYWMSVGAQPTETARSLIKRARKEAAATAEA